MSDIRNVSDTALWVAMYRAMESERPDAIFRDPYARELAGERGAAIVRTMPKARELAWPMIVRTAVMDEIILRTVRERGARTVVNLAAGLDARAFRLPLPPSLTWLHVDLPDMVAYVREHLKDKAPACALEYVIADLVDEHQRATVLDRAAVHGPTLAITEGLLIYLEPEQVAELGRELAARPAIEWWLLDLGSPRLLAMLKKTWQPSLAAGNAPMRFAPAEGTAFFEPLGWSEVEFRSTWTESLRLGRSARGAWLLRHLERLLPRARREENRLMSGMVLLERAR